jgi:hypothetical protein
MEWRCSKAGRGFYYRAIVYRLGKCGNLAGQFFIIRLTEPDNVAVGGYENVPHGSVLHGGGHALQDFQGHMEDGRVKASVRRKRC